ncbi:hypothetical protein [Paraburkholderia phytofirmans]|uniref:Uncharacterized protein n=1 Tax=Paraburkholderia phytofirmans TaxID=261302 RepID=A0ABW9BES2_9BURK
MKPSYDEKKQKKSRIVFSDLFSALITDRMRVRRVNAANLAANRRRDDSVLPHANNVISNRRHAI